MNVEEINPVWINDAIVSFDVHARLHNNSWISKRTKNLVLGTGLHPKMPGGVERSSRVWHSSELLHRLSQFDVMAPARFVVVGAGQSAAEVTEYLHRTFPTAEVCSLFSRLAIALPMMVSL